MSDETGRRRTAGVPPRLKIARRHVSCLPGGVGDAGHQRFDQQTIGRGQPPWAVAKNDLIAFLTQGRGENAGR